MSKQELKYISILKTAADTPDRLRRSDVYRVLDEAKQAGCLSDFVDWLKDQPVPFTIMDEVDKAKVNIDMIDHLGQGSKYN